MFLMVFIRLNTRTQNLAEGYYLHLSYLVEANMSLRSKALALSPLFQDIDSAARLSHDERIQLTYKRLIAIGKAYRPCRSFLCPNYISNTL